ncbi:capsid protein [Methylocystis sp. L43]|uniref:Capsid protein n=1 Tax=Methylocystis rosea TaxID=173366 RepID=A0ABX6EGS5_9HYPH|nr:MULTISPECIES: capsid protein [Methylocystis]MBG0796841.1 capsid protein [Methylocystis sp. L43]MBG0806128.1 capsid protein [Methylocystis sp. H15]QGM93785.1 capsid protein [Methylocystis rosea]
MSVARPFVRNAAMTAIAIGYSNPDVAYIGDRLMPRVPVPTERFKWLEYPLGQAFTVPDTRVGRKGKVKEVEFSATEKDGSVEAYGLQIVVPRSDIDAAKAQRDQGLSNFDPLHYATGTLTNIMQLDRELRVAKFAQDPANYDPANVTTIASAGDRFDDPDSDPEDAIHTALVGVFMTRPNTCAMSDEVWQKLRRQPKLVKKIKGTNFAEGQLTQREFAEYFELLNLLIGTSWVNAARPGQALDMKRAWDKHIAFAFIDRSARPEGGVTWGFSPTFGTRFAGSMVDPDVGLEGGEVVRVGEHINELVVAKAAGALIVNAIS